MICLTPVVYWWWFHRLWFLSERGILVLQRWHLQYIRRHEDINRMSLMNGINSGFSTRYFLLFRMLEVRINWTQGSFAGTQQVLIVKVIPFISKIKAHSWYLGRWNVSTVSVWNSTRHLRMSTCLANISLTDLPFTICESWNIKHRISSKTYKQGN